MTTVIGIILLLVGVAWLLTLRFFTPISGQLYVRKSFGHYDRVIGIGILKTKIERGKTLSPTVENLLLDEHDNLKVRIDSSKTLISLIYPLGIARFDYTYKRMKTLKEVRDTHGTLSWPESPEGLNDNSTVLGEWKERNKNSLFAWEREEIAIPFISQDKYKGVAFAYLKFTLWDMTKGISSMYSQKKDAEIAIRDRFQKWATSVPYLIDGSNGTATQIQGVSFEDLPYARNFYKIVNDSIYPTGWILEEIQFFNFALDKSSQDLFDKAEDLRKAELDQKTAKVKADTAETFGDGERRKMMKINAATIDLQRQEADVLVTKEQGLATVAVGKDKQIKKNETDQFIEQEAAKLGNDEKRISALGEYKKIPDATEIGVAKGLGKTKGTVFYQPGEKAGSELDDKILESGIKANLITKK